MGLIPDETIAEIRDRADIVAVIGQHVELKKAGRNHKGLCPFHQERSPSFNVNGDKGFYYCFGCHQKGDVFSFVMEYEGKSFVEAAETLAAQLGILIPKADEAPDLAARGRSAKSEMLEVNRIACEFFRGQLLGSRGQLARDYLNERGIGARQSELFALGYAPNDWRSLCDFLEARGVDLQVAEAVGLIVKQPQRAGHYDRFRERLMCPIMTTGGDVVGFSGRTLARGDEAAKAGAKYINSPESPVYKKSKLLFGVYQARDAMRSAGNAIVVEGNFDVIRLHENGFAQTVAPLGTALTEDQALRLRRLTPQVVLLYDGDNAGRAATLKALMTLLGQEVSVRIATLPMGEDPDSLIASRGAEALQQIIQRAQPAVEYFIHEVWVQADRSAEGRARTLSEAAQVFINIKDETQRDFAIGTFATALGVKEDTLRKGLRRAYRDLRSGGSARQNEAASRVPLASREPPDARQLGIICLLAEFPELLPLAEEASILKFLTDPRLKDMYAAAKDGAPMLSAVEDPGIARALLQREYSGIPNPAQTFKSAMATVKETHIRQRKLDLHRRLTEAQRRGDTELAHQLLLEMKEIN